MLIVLCARDNVSNLLFVYLKMLREGGNALNACMCVCLINVFRESLFESKAERGKRNAVHALPRAARRRELNCGVKRKRKWDEYNCRYRNRLKRVFD